MNEAHKQRIIQLTQGCDLQSPVSLDAEFGNALSAMIKRNRISITDAKRVIQQFSSVAIRRTAIRMDEAIELSGKYDLYAYDAYVLDCAMQYRTPLLSLDKKMGEIAKQLPVQLLEVTK